MPAATHPNRKWFNEPPAWNEQGDTLTVTTAPKTDFWRKTHYGFVRDNGHFYYQTIHGDFTLEVKFSGQYSALYDQAGLMVRLDASTWLKTGIEYVHGLQHVSAVVTREFSDWSVVPLASNPASLWMRLLREREAIQVFYAVDGVNFSLLRVLYLTPDDALDAGIMCASPEGDGFTTIFQGLKVQPGLTFSS